MKTLLLASVAISGLCMCAVSSRAADVVEPHYFDWTGVYFGLHAGYGFGSVDTHLDFRDASGHGDVDGFVGGGLVGWNYQLNRIVLGAETDIGFSDIRGTGQLDGTVGFAPKLDDFEIQPSGHVRVRLGLAFDRVMPFVAGGVALADTDLSINATPFFDDSDTKFRIGYSIGGGVDFALTDNILLRGEYLYDDYGRQSYDLGGSNADLSVNTNTVRGALIWIFN